MVLTEVVRGAAPGFRKVNVFRAFATPIRTLITWPEQDKWEDPRGPLGIDRPSPKLAPLTSESPQWLHDLHNKGVSVL